MKFVWFSLAGVVILMLVFYLTARTIAIFFHNIFYRTKKRFSWDAMENWGDLDLTEDFYHR